MKRETVCHVPAGDWQDSLLKERMNPMDDETERNWWDTPTAWVATVVLVGFTALSAYINARYAIHTSTEVWLHAGIPLVVLVTALLAELTFLSSAHGWARAVGLVGFLSVFVVVIVASYMAVLSMMTEVWNAGQPWTMNAFLSAVPDAVMVICSVTLLSLRHKSHKRQPSTEARKQRGAGRWSRLADAATRRAEAALAVSETPQVDTLTEAHGAPAEGLTAAPQTSAETFVEDFAEPPSTSPEDSAKPVEEAPSTSTKPAAKVSAKAVDAELLPFMEAAMAMEEDGLVRGKTALDYAKVIAAVEQRWSPNRIKKELGYSTSTTEKVRHAWHERQRADQRQLSAVG